MIGAGIFVLTGIAAGEAGPAALLAFALNGLVTLLTALSYAELASAYPKSGGGYSYILKAFPGPAGFASGWMLWFCYIIACALYALGFGSYFWEFVRGFSPALAGFVFNLAGAKAPVLVMTALVGILFIFINMRGTALTGSVENIITMSKIIILGIFIAYGIKRILQLPVEAMESFTPFLPNGAGGVVIAMGLTFIAFEGYDLIATVAEEIKAPEKTIPRATLISLCVTVFIYLMILLVCIGAIQPESGESWQFLGLYQETAIVHAAQRFMPFFGAALIVFGGLLSTISALNATILASSRVAFSMSRDKMLPSPISKIHTRRRTPHMAIAVTGAIVLAMALLFPIQVIGSAASVMFLLTFALVNLALIALRRKFPELKGGFRVPFYPATPIAAVFLNLFLALYQFNFAPRAWYITAAWIMAEVADKVVRHAPCELITVDLMGDRPIRRILITTAGGPHASLAAEYVGIYLDTEGFEVTCCYVVAPDADVTDSEKARQWIQKTIRSTKLEGKAHTRLLEGKKVASTLIRAAADYDLIILGASKEGLFSNVLFGEIPEKIARYARTPVMIVQRYEGPVKSFIKKVMG